MKLNSKFILVFAGVVFLAIISVFLGGRPTPQKNASVSKEQPSLTVSVTTLQTASLPTRILSTGSIMPWQEASVGAEANGLRLVEIKVNVGDKVRRGQVLAIFASETVRAELELARAAVAEAETTLEEAIANSERTHSLENSGALSKQQIQQYETAARTAQFRLDSARATERLQRLRLQQTQVVAPDDGIISVCEATLGAVIPAGQELFRLIRGGRLEWRAEVTATDLGKLKMGQKVRIIPSGGEALEGRLRMPGPVIDVQTRNALVYVDLPANNTVRAGMFARGEFDLGTREVMTLPQSAVQQRDGFSYVLRVGSDSRAIQTKVETGSSSHGRIEIVSGLTSSDRVVVAGAAFLGDGDLVRIVEDVAVLTQAKILTHTEIQRSTQRTN